MKLHGFSAAALLAQTSFPRISPDEEALLRDWLREYGRLYDSFSIDVPVGRGRSVVAETSDVFDRMWALITRRRIDVLAVYGNCVDVVEAKVHATMPAATQVRTYCDDLMREQPQWRRVRPLIVCRSAAPGLMTLMYSVGGRLVEIPAIVASRDDNPHDFTEERHDDFREKH